MQLGAVATSDNNRPIAIYRAHVSQTGWRQALAWLPSSFAAKSGVKNPLHSFDRQSPGLDQLRN
jgi:hypothetical protein